MTSPNGLLLIDKPSGPTSHDIVDQVRDLLGTRAVGHAGTLDPFASGLLILGVGAGTKALTELVGLDKTYLAQLKLGTETDTYDRTGVQTNTKAPLTIPDQKMVLDCLNTFVGSQIQLAPLYSAKKRQGKKLYELARAGTATEDMRPSKEITVYHLALLEYAWPFLTIETRVSSGTYIRSLGHDFGQALGGVCAYIHELRRTSIGPYKISQSIQLDSLLPEAVFAHLQPLDSLLKN